jgi:hypothetical protein
MARWKNGSDRGRHHTVHRDARRAVAWLDTQPEIEKLILGRYRPHRPRGTSPGGLGVRAECPAGVTLEAYTGEGVLELTAVVPAAGRGRLVDRIAGRWPASRAAAPRG